jgi:hypothetical protein
MAALAGSFCEHHYYEIELETEDLTNILVCDGLSSGTESVRHDDSGFVRTLMRAGIHAYTV